MVDAHAIPSPAPFTPSAAHNVRELITPEGIDLHLQLSDVSERVTAFLLDVALMVAALIGMTLVVIGFALLTRRPVEVQLIAIVWLLGWFFLRNFYFVAFELTTRCATPGKRALGLRVVSRNGGPVGFDAIFARNAMRELELFLPLSFTALYAREIGGWSVVAGAIWCAIFVFFPLFNSDRLRVGDLVAGTWVVRAPARVLEPELLQEAQCENRYRFTRAEVDVYGIKELGVLEAIIRRRDQDTMTTVAARIRAKIGRPATVPESDEEFLQSYYAAVRERLESRLLFGERKRDKFDLSRTPRQGSPGLRLP